eukprot:1948900-Rhodomonas_salina.1
MRILSLVRLLLLLLLLLTLPRSHACASPRPRPPPPRSLARPQPGRTPPNQMKSNARQHFPGTPRTALVPFALDLAVPAREKKYKEDTSTRLYCRP